MSLLSLGTFFTKEITNTIGDYIGIGLFRYFIFSKGCFVSREAAEKIRSSYDERDVLSQLVYCGDILAIRMMLIDNKGDFVVDKAMEVCILHYNSPAIFDMLRCRVNIVEHRSMKSIRDDILRASHRNKTTEYYITKSIQCDNLYAFRSFIDATSNRGNDIRVNRMLRDASHYGAMTIFRYILDRYGDRVLYLEAADHLYHNHKATAENKELFSSIVALHFDMEDLLQWAICDEDRGAYADILLRSYNYKMPSEMVTTNLYAIVEQGITVNQDNTIFHLQYIHNFIAQHVPADERGWYHINITQCRIYTANVAILKWLTAHGYI